MKTIRWGGAFVLLLSIFSFAYAEERQIFRSVSQMGVGIRGLLGDQFGAVGANQARIYDFRFHGTVGDGHGASGVRWSEAYIQFGNRFFRMSTEKTGFLGFFKSFELSPLSSDEFLRLADSYNTRERTADNLTGGLDNVDIFLVDISRDFEVKGLLHFALQMEKPEVLESQRLRLKNLKRLPLLGSISIVPRRISSAGIEITCRDGFAGFSQTSAQ